MTITSESSSSPIHQRKHHYPQHYRTTSKEISEQITSNYNISSPIKYTTTNRLGGEESESKTNRAKMTNFQYNMNGTKIAVLLILCLQNSIFTVLRRYSQGVLKERYSSYEVLLLGEVVKLVFSAFMIHSSLVHSSSGQTILSRLVYLSKKSLKMAVLALIYGAMNILSFVALRNIGAGTFTIFAQCKILTTASFSAIMLNRSYSWAQWRALIQLMVGVLLFSVNLFDNNDVDDDNGSGITTWGSAILGTGAVVTEVTLSGFASIYFEKVIKHDAEKLGIWERNFQLALGSIPIYILFILHAGGGEAGYGGGWSYLASTLAMLGAAGGLLVALSIKHGDSILKTLATTGAIILSSFLDHYLLSGPLTFVMILGGINVVLAICNYSFDATPNPKSDQMVPQALSLPQDSETVNLMSKKETEGSPLEVERRIRIQRDLEDQ